MCYGGAGGDLRAAIVFAPDVPLSRACAMLPVAAVGLQNALGVLAPPEIAVHLSWDGGIRVNGAACGHLRMIGPDRAADAIPDWLIVTLEMPFLPETEETGETPDRTALYAEGCGELTPNDLLEAWVRHTLSWINRWSDDGPRAVYAEWRTLAPEGHKTAFGPFVGLGDDFALITRDGDSPVEIPLTRLIAVPA